VGDFLSYLEFVPEKFTHASLIKGDMKLTQNSTSMVLTILRKLGLVERKVFYHKQRSIGKWRRIEDKKLYWNLLTKLRKKYVYSGGKN